jgi:hypothetical protein
MHRRRWSMIFAPNVWGTQTHYAQTVSVTTAALMITHHVRGVPLKRNLLNGKKEKATIWKSTQLV